MPPRDVVDVRVRVCSSSCCTGSDVRPSIYACRRSIDVRKTVRSAAAAADALHSAVDNIRQAFDFLAFLVFNKHTILLLVCQQRPSTSSADWEQSAV